MIEIESPDVRSQRRGRRAVVVAAAAALVAGTSGFLLGRSTDHAGRGVGAVPTTAASPVVSSATTSPVGTTETLPTTTVWVCLRDRTQHHQVPPRPPASPVGCTSPARTRNRR